MVRDTGLDTTAAISGACPKASCASETAMIVLNMTFLLPIIITTPGIHRVQRRRGHRSPALENGIYRRQDRECRKGGNDQPADNGAAERCGLRTALGEANRHGYHAEYHRHGRHQDCSQTTRCS